MRITRPAEVPGRFKVTKEILKKEKRPELQDWYGNKDDYKNSVSETRNTADEIHCHMSI